MFSSKRRVDRSSRGLLSNAAAAAEAVGEYCFSMSFTYSNSYISFISQDPIMIAFEFLHDCFEIPYWLDESDGFVDDSVGE